MSIFPHLGISRDKMISRYKDNTIFTYLWEQANSQSLNHSVHMVSICSPSLLASFPSVVESSRLVSSVTSQRSTHTSKLFVYLLYGHYWLFRYTGYGNTFYCITESHSSRDCHLACFISLATECEEESINLLSLCFIGGSNKDHSFSASFYY